LPELFYFRNLTRISDHHNCLRLPGEYLFPTDLRPRHAACGKDIFATAEFKHLVLDGAFAGGEQRLAAKLQEDSFFSGSVVSGFQRRIVAEHLLCSLFGFNRRRAKRGEGAQRLGNLLDAHRIYPHHLDPKRRKLVNLTFGIAAAPGQHQIRL